MIKKKANREKTSIVVEVSGGVLVGVYTNVAEASVVTVDWDNINCEGSAVLYEHNDLDALPSDTRIAYENTIKHERNM